MIIAVVAVIIIAAAAYFLLKPAPEPTPQENKPPIAVATSTRYFAVVGDSVGVTAEGSRDPDGSIASYDWDFGDAYTTTGESASHVYDLPGNYIISLTVTDDDDATSNNDASPIFIKVDRVALDPDLESPPVALMAASDEMVAEDEEVSFIGAGSFGWKLRRGEITADTTKITEWSWDFGDGSSGNEASVEHSYSATGNYLVELTVKDATGQEDTVVRTIRVFPPGVEYEGEIKNPDTYVFATAMGMSTSLDLWRISGGNVGRQVVLTLSDLLVFTGQGDIEPQAEGSLSESWDISDDGMVYTFHLRDDIKFWNGDELTAEDVEYTYERIMALSLARNRWGLMYERLMGYRPGEEVPDAAVKAAVEAVDEKTVVFTLSSPYAPLLNDLAYPSTGIIQKKHAIDNGAWSWDDTRDFSAIDGVDKPMEDGDALMCTGAYTVLEWSKGERMVFERNDDYWKGPAKTEYFRFLTVPEWSTRSLMLRAGDADGITIATPTEFEQLVGVPGINTVQIKYRGFVEVMYFGLDVDPSQMPPEHEVPADFFNDEHMRKAFAYAFPYEQYIEEIWLGYAEAAKGVIPEGWLGHYENYPYTHDLEKAEEELKLAHGGKYWDEGFQVAAGTQLWAMGTHGRAYELLGEEFAKIDPKFKIVPVGTSWSDMLNMPLGMLVGVIGLDPVWYRNIYHSDYGFEYSYGWKNERVDELIVQSTETPFIDERLPLLQEAMDIVAEECPAILTVFNPQFGAFNDYIEGYWYQVNHVVDGGFVHEISKGG
jgi:peptide/nickel transport system substrate-binding protein